MHFQKKTKIILFSILFISLTGSEFKKRAIQQTTFGVDSITIEPHIVKETKVEILKYKEKVNGKDEEGNPVHGKIHLEGKNGLGILTNNDGEKIEIVFEMLTRTKIIATDIQGITYNLKIK